MMESGSNRRIFRKCIVLLLLAVTPIAVFVLFGRGENTHTGLSVFFFTQPLSFISAVIGTINGIKVCSANPKLGLLIIILGIVVAYLTLITTLMGVDFFFQLD